MYQAVGYTIRQLRREQSLTQTALGSNRFSKSYVSAVERGKISPSREALLFFAEQLGQPADYFVLRFNSSENGNGTQVTISGIGEASRVEDQAFLDEELAFLDALLEQAEYYDFPLQQKAFRFSEEVLALLPLSKQARYYFLAGLMAQREENYQASISLLEMAQALSPQKYQPALLDALGMNYYFTRRYQVALAYHSRALQALEHVSGDPVAPRVRFRIELHCANDNLALGAYQQAHAHFEQARTYLDAQQEMKSAALLYWGLGYCAYILAFQESIDLSSAGTGSPDALERRYQHAFGYLIQSRSIYQISSDAKEEARVRLTLVMAILDLCTWRRRCIAGKAQQDGQGLVRVAGLLDDAAEQCRQVLMQRLQQSAEQAPSPEDWEPLALLALAYMVRITVLKAALAHTGGYHETILRERAIAASLCEQLLHAVRVATLPEQLVRNVGRQEAPLAYQFASLPRLPDPDTIAARWRNSQSLAEVYVAAGEVAEEFARGASTREYIADCYAHADSCFQASLDMQISLERVQSAQDDDPGHLLRSYQRYISLLEERACVDPEYEPALSLLLHTCKRAFLQFQSAFLLLRSNGMAGNHQSQESNVLRDSP